MSSLEIILESLDKKIDTLNKEKEDLIKYCSNLKCEIKGIIYMKGSKGFISLKINDINEFKDIYSQLQPCENIVIDSASGIIAESNFPVKVYISNYTHISNGANEITFHYKHNEDMDIRISMNIKDLEGDLKSYHFIEDKSEQDSGYTETRLKLDLTIQAFYSGGIVSNYAYYSMNEIQKNSFNKFLKLN